MKRSIYFLLTMLLCVCLLGCERDVPILEPSLPTEPPVPTQPVEEDVFYYSNELEYSRLYRQREDGSDLELVLDVYCYNVQQHGDTVYFMDGSDLQGYHIPTGTSRIVAEEVFDYVIDGDDLVYLVDSDKIFYTDLRYRNLTTGEDYLIDTIVINAMAVKNGNLYYVENDFESYYVALKAFNLQTHQTSILADQFSTVFSLIADSDGVFFEAYDLEYTGLWYYASADGTSFDPLTHVPTVDANVIHVTKDSALYVHWDYTDEDVSQLYTCGADGIPRLLFEAEPSAYLHLSALGSGRWLILQQLDEGIGELNEYGYHDDYAHHLRYYLLRADGTVIPLDAAGELASMFATGDFPLLDSSTARKPVTRALYDLFVRNFGYEGKEPICSTTHGAWLNIADRKVDMALLAAPTEEEWAYLQQQGVEVELKLYGGDGLVFIGNAANPVTNLTHEQIIAIYRGEITNWSEVGGPDHPITVYYRDDQSGSQRLFEKLVFKGEDIPDFSGMGFALMDDMSTIVNIILEDPYSIGYSIMTYLDEVYAEEELQVFAVNGAIPSPDTIKDGTYPYNTQGYLVIRSDEPEDSPARRLFNWFGCPVSDDLLTFNSISPFTDGVG